MQLPTVFPHNAIDGIFATADRHEGTIVKSEAFRKHFIDHYLEVRISCDGSNPNYPKVDCKRAIFSQYIGGCNIGLRSSDPNSVIIILKADQRLERIRLTEGQFGGGGLFTPVLIISTKRTSDAVVEDLCWQVFEDISLPVK